MKHKILFLTLIVLFGSFSLARAEVPTKTTSEKEIQKQEILGLIQELGESDIIANYQAGRKLLKLKKEAVPFLIKGLNDNKGRIRFASIILLEQIGDKRAIPSFIKIFEDKKRKRKERMATALALGRMEAKGAGDVLISGLSEPSNSIQGASAVALGMLKEERAVPQLLQLLESKKEEIKKCALRALEAIGDEGIEELEKMVKEGSLSEQFLSLQVLGKINSEKSVKLLCETLKNEDKHISLSAAYVLSELGISDGKEVAEKNLTSKDPKIRMLSVKTLENLKKGKATK